jgi:Oxidoreductase-like protein, N-terminal
MSGCAICIHDLYLDALAAYHESVSSLRMSLSALDIPESEWPSNIQTSGVESKEERKSDVNTDAFLALERSLREKKATDNLSSS